MFCLSPLSLSCASSFLFSYVNNFFENAQEIIIPVDTLTNAESLAASLTSDMTTQDELFKALGPSLSLPVQDYGPAEARSAQYISDVTSNIVLRSIQVFVIDWDPGNLETTYWHVPFGDLKLDKVRQLCGCFIFVRFMLIICAHANASIGSDMIFKHTYLV